LFLTFYPGFKLYNWSSAIMTTLQTTAKDHTLALKEHSTEVDALYNKIIELEIQDRRSGCLLLLVDSFY
jgi:hypothetical protein